MSRFFGLGTFSFYTFLYLLCISIIFCSQVPCTFFQLPSRFLFSLHVASFLSSRSFYHTISLFFFSVLYSTPLMTSESQGWLPRSRVRSTCFRHPLKSERERERERDCKRERERVLKKKVSH